MWNAVGARQRRRCRLLRSTLGVTGHRSSLGIDAEFDHQIEQNRYRLAILDGWLELSLADSGHSVLIEPEADGTADNDLLRRACGADNRVIECNAGNAACCAYSFDSGSMFDSSRALVSTVFWRSTAGSLGW